VFEQFKEETENMNAFDLLKADHKKVAELFDQLDAASGQKKIEVFKQIKSELELHTHIEEKVFYPVLETPEETHDLTLEAYEEHKVVKTLLAELSGARSATDEWQAKAKVLRENVEHHVEEEENELFKKADDALSDEAIEALGARMEAEKARKQGRPVPKLSTAKTASRKTKAAKPGLLSKIANFVGLGGDKAKEPAASKTAAKKSAPKKAAKVTSRAATKKNTGKAFGASASKRSPAATAAKRAPSGGSTGSAKKRSGASSGKKSAKKRASRN
jgi:hemerythrin-like domain-containing protein